MPPDQGSPKATIVIRDRVSSRNPGHEKVWLFHSLEEPVIEGLQFTVRKNGANYGGILVSHSLKPGKARLEKIGGPGKEFWVTDTNYATTKSGTCEAGAWRVEVTSQEPAKEIDFLHVLLVYPRAVGDPPVPALVEGDGGVVGAELLDRTVIFCTPEVAIGGRLTYSSEGNGQREHLIIGLPPGKTATVSAGGNTLGQLDTSPGGALSFKVDQKGKTEVRIAVTDTRRAH